MSKNPIATIVINNKEYIRLELYPKSAPNTVNSFIYVSNEGLYNNRAIKRIVKDFVIQPSYCNFEDPRCDFFIDGEFDDNGFHNDIRLDKWTVAMAGDGERIASGSEFFITIGDNEERLNGKFAAFGKVIEGFEVLQRLAGVETKVVESNMEGVIIREPIKPEIITEVYVETFDDSYLRPVILDRLN
ncbi:MAG: peptidylprolyl isomerase [Clostridium sp.]